MTICYSCLSNTGERRISPGMPIYAGDYWVVEHAFPTGLLGWVVIVLKRHCEALHALTEAEWHELASIQYRLTQALHTQTGSQKEYAACFAELEGFTHIHFHIVPKTAVFDDAYKGAKVFQYLRMDADAQIPAADVAQFCIALNTVIQA